jgi:hypothetical protein
VFNVHEELICLFELAAASASHRTVERIFRGVPMSDFLKPPSKSDVTACLARIREIMQDLISQADIQLLQPRAPMASCFTRVWHRSVIILLRRKPLTPHPSPLALTCSSSACPRSSGSCPPLMPSCSVALVASRLHHCA